MSDFIQKGKYAFLSPITCIKAKPYRENNTDNKVYLDYIGEFVTENDKGERIKAKIHIPKMSLNIESITIDEETYSFGKCKTVVSRSAYFGKNEEDTLFEILIPKGDRL